MLRDREFLVLRYSLIEERQGAIAVSPLPSRKGDAVAEYLMREGIFIYHNISFSFVGFVRVGESYLVGKVAKRRKAHIGVRTETDVVELEEDDWVAALLFVDLDDQFMLLGRNWRMGALEQILGGIEHGLLPLVQQYNHKAFVRPVIDPGSFWRLVDSKRSLYKVRLRLVSPNILDTDRDARAAVEALKEIFNQDETTIELRNDSGSLQLPNWLKSYITYIENGEGEWRLVTEGDVFGKKTFKSTENIQTVSIAIDEELHSNRDQGELPQVPQKIGSLGRATIDSALTKVRGRRKNK
jgi:hypothetical protein